MVRGITSSFDNIQIAAFWKDANQISITKAETISVIQEEGLVQVRYLHKFNKEDLEAVFKALRNPPGKVVVDKLVPRAAFVIFAKIKKRVMIAAVVPSYYK